MSRPTTRLRGVGQSLWCDQLSRAMIRGTGMRRLIEEDDVRGVTSNPSIFEKSIREEREYDEEILRLATEGRSPFEIYDALTRCDIAETARLFAGIFRESGGIDGYVSLEVDPRLAHDSEKTVTEAVRLFEDLGEPNIMIKIPATREGLPAIEEALFRGLNVNATLIFSDEVYEDVADRYIRALERRTRAGLPVAGIASVASCFVSRIDTAVDEAIAGKKAPAELRGKTAIATIARVYKEFRDIFGEPRFEKLRREGAMLQRPLWASTSTKNPVYPDVLYVEELIAEDTVNTVPPETMAAFADHGVVDRRLEKNLEWAEEHFEKLAAAEISVLPVYEKLEADGVAAFVKAFEGLLELIEKRARNAR